VETGHIETLNLALEETMVRAKQLTVYHGTTDLAASQIKQNGLQPHRSTAWNAMTNYGINIQDNWPEQQPWCYVTMSKPVATKFAQMRAGYEKTRPGEVIPETPHWIKEAQDIHPKVRPVVITFHLPIGWKHKFQADPDTGDLTLGLVTSETIPATYIGSVEVLQ
jgi:hypothetical protein